MIRRKQMKKLILASVVGCTLMLPVHAYADSSHVNNDLILQYNDSTLLVENYEIEIKEAKAELSKLKEEMEELMEGVETAKDNVTAVREMIEEHEELIAEYEGTLQSLKRDLSVGFSVLEDKIIVLSERKETLLEIEKLYKKRLVESEENKKSLAKKIEKAESTLQSSKQEIELQDVTLEEGKIFIRPTEGRISSEFGPRWGRLHNGIDIANSIGTPILAAADGVVKEARTMNGYGKTIILQHKINGQTYETLYAHLNDYHVSPGEKVKAGQPIAQMGNTGKSTGPHLHFETHVGTWNGKKSNAVDPRKLTGF